MKEDDWDWIMACARSDAAVYKRRARVRALPATERWARINGRRWMYVVVAQRGRR